MKASQQNNRKQSKGVSSSPNGQELCHTSKVHRSQKASVSGKSITTYSVQQHADSSLSHREIVKDGSRVRGWQNVRTDLSPINPPPLPPKK